MKKEKEFMLLSQAKSFQRKKGKEGYKTKIEHYLGIAFPYRIVKYWKD